MHNITVVQLLVIPNIIRKVGCIHEFLATLTWLPPMCVNGRTNSHAGVPESSSSALCEVISIKHRVPQMSATYKIFAILTYSLYSSSQYFYVDLEGKLHSSKQPGVKTPLQVLPTILYRIKNFLPWRKKWTLRLITFKLSADPSFRLVSGIPYLSCWKLLIKNNHEEK